MGPSCWLPLWDVRRQVKPSSEGLAGLLSPDMSQWPPSCCFRAMERPGEGNGCKMVHQVIGVILIFTELSINSRL